MRAWLLDIDGTTLLGADPLPGALDLVGWLRAQGRPFLWVTNNTSRTRAAWIERLRTAGLEPSPHEIFTAGDATLDWLLALAPPPRVYLLGTRALAAEFAAAGVRIATAAEADLVLLAYDTELTYAKLRDAALLLRRGARYVATHPDANCPTPDGPLPDVGSMIALLATSCGRTPEVIGKPNATMVQGALARLGVEPGDAVIVGDRLATDVRMGCDAGIRTFLVLSGVTTRAEAAVSTDRPSAVFDSLADVLAHARRTAD